jgi:hypothetical protein
MAESDKKNTRSGGELEGKPWEMDLHNFSTCSAGVPCLPPMLWG